MFLDHQKTASCLVGILFLSGTQAVFAKANEPHSSESLKNRSEANAETMEGSNSHTTKPNKLEIDEIKNFDSNTAPILRYKISNNNHLFVGKSLDRTTDQVLERQRFNKRMDIPPLKPAVEAGFTTRF